MPGLIPLILFLASISFFLGGYFISSTFYYKKHDVKYAITRMFPYEVNYPSTFKNNIYGNIAFIASVVMTISFYIYNVSMINKDVTHIVITIMAVVSAFLILALFFMPLAFLRAHIIVATVMMTLALGLPALNAFAALSSYKNASEDLAKVVAVNALVIGALLAAVTFIFILNPKATYKIYLDKSVDDYGNEVFIRPRFIPVAFNEWWSILTYIVSPLPLLLISFI